MPENTAANYLPLLFFALLLSAFLLGLFAGFLIWFSKRKSALAQEKENLELNLIANDLRDEMKKMKQQLNLTN